MKDNPLNNIKIASPCSANWETMVGDDKKRFCGDCKLNVYNLSGMSRTEAENLMIETEGRLCVRFYRRHDGTILTEDCPVGWAKVKRQVSRAATAVVSLIIGLFTGLFAFNFSAKKEYDTVGQRVPANVPVNVKVKIEKDEDSCNRPMMGTPVPITRQQQVAGGITNIEEVRQQVKQKRDR
jgi:hypothetical protein